MLVFLLVLTPLPDPTLLPYTTLFRSLETVLDLSPDALQDLLREPRPRGRSLRHTEIADFLPEDRKSTRLNSSHVAISYAVVRLQKTPPRRQASGAYISTDAGY